MYRISILLVSCFLLANRLQAQNPFVGKDSLQVNNIMYHCWTSPNGRITVWDKQCLTAQPNYAKNRKQLLICDYYLEYNRSIIDNAIATVLTPTQRATLKTHEFTITFFMKPATGIIQEMDFRFNETCSITAAQIYALEQALKGKQMDALPECVPQTFVAFKFDL